MAWAHSLPLEVGQRQPPGRGDRLRHQLTLEGPRRARIHHIGTLTDDTALAFSLGLTALPQRPPTWAPIPGACGAGPTHTLLTGLVLALGRLGLATGEQGSTATSTPSVTTVMTRCWKALRAPPLPAHPRCAHLLRPRSRLERDGLQRRLTKAEQASEIIAFADYWNTATGAEPGLLVYDSQLTTYKMFDQLTDRVIRWLTLRQREQRARHARNPLEEHL